MQILFPYLGYEVDWEESSNSVQCLHTLSHASLEEKVSNWKLVSWGSVLDAHPRIGIKCGIQYVIFLFLRNLFAMFVNSFLHTLFPTPHW